MMEALPLGFEPHFRKSPVTDPWEPLYSCLNDGQFRLGLRIAAPHCNARGVLHGGVISTLADNAMGLSCVMQSKDVSALTVQLSTSFLAVGKLDQWLEVRAEPTKLGGSITFAKATVIADDMLIATASAIFKLLKRA